MILTSDVLVMPNVQCPMSDVEEKEKFGSRCIEIRGMPNVRRSTSKKEQDLERSAFKPRTSDIKHRTLK